MSNRFEQSMNMLENNKKKTEIKEEPKKETVNRTVFEKEVAPTDQAETKSAQTARKPRRKAIEYNLSLPLVVKNMRLPAELDSCVKKLKEKMNSDRVGTREKIVTEEAIIIEALENLFLQPGIYSEILEQVLEKMSQLSQGARNR